LGPAAVKIEQFDWRRRLAVCGARQMGVGHSPRCPTLARRQAAGFVMSYVFAGGVDSMA
jgi:hypothetical protein